MNGPLGGAARPRSSAVSPASASDLRNGERLPNIVWIVLDCVRAKSVRLGGATDGAATPTLDRLSRKGTVFPQAIAPANWTIPSHMSFFTGVYPNVHGRRTFRRDTAPRETVASVLRRKGYETAMFTEMVHLVGGYGLEDGFDHREARHIGISDEQRTVVNQLAGHADVLYTEKVRRLLGRLPPLIVPMNAFNHPQEVAFKSEVCGPETVAQFGRWVGSRSAERPFFAFVNLVDAHEPYPILENGSPVGFLARWYSRTPRYYLLAVPGLQGFVPWSAVVRGYHRSVELADAKVGAIVEHLVEQDEFRRTLFVVTADHGQSFGEGGNVYHGCGATDSITRVPLLVVPPEGVSVPRRVDRWTSLCELVSWTKAVASGQPPFDDQGHAPFPFVASAPDDSVVYCEGAPASDPNRSLRGVRPEQLWNHRLLAAYQGETKAILDLDTGRVYRWILTGDPDTYPPEVLLGAEADRVRRELFGAYEATEADRRLSAPSDGEGGELNQRLRSWGYA